MVTPSHPPWYFLDFRPTMILLIATNLIQVVHCKATAGILGERVLVLFRLLPAATKLFIVELKRYVGPTNILYSQTHIRALWF